MDRFLRSSYDHLTTIRTKCTSETTLCNHFLNYITRGDNSFPYVQQCCNDAQVNIYIFQLQFSQSINGNGYINRA